MYTSGDIRGLQAEVWEIYVGVANLAEFMGVDEADLELCTSDEIEDRVDEYCRDIAILGWPFMDEVESSWGPSFSIRELLIGYIERAAYEAKESGGMK